jgi:hypothetical protein
LKESQGQTLEAAWQSSAGFGESGKSFEGGSMIGVDDTTKQIILRLLRENGTEVYEDPPGFWWLVIGPGEIAMPVDALELTADLKWVQLKRKYFHGGDN